MSDVCPAPGQARWTSHNGTRDSSCSNDISRKVFGTVIKDDFEARGWLQQWRACIPHYINWQITRQQDWQVQDVEVDAERHYEKLRLKGRIDRIDEHESRLGIVDYKTGLHHQARKCCRVKRYSCQAMH